MDQHLYFNLLYSGARKSKRELLWGRSYEITKERSQNVNSVNRGVFHQSKQNINRIYEAKANKRAINSIKLSEQYEGAWRASKAGTAINMSMA